MKAGPAQSTPQHQTNAAAPTVSEPKRLETKALKFDDNREEFVAQTKLQDMIDTSPPMITQRKQLDHVFRMPTRPGQLARHIAPNILQRRTLEAEKSGRLSPQPAMTQNVILRNTPDGVVQRDVVRDDNSDTVSLDRFNRASECVQEITTYIYTKRYRRGLDVTSGYDALFDAVSRELKRNGKYMEVIRDPRKRITIDQLAGPIYHKLLTPKEQSKIGRDHLEWLEEELASYVKAKVDLLPLMSHAASLQEEHSALFAHYNAFNKNMLWRFTSTPSQEFVFVAPGTKYKEILQIVAKHSGGNDKSNANVRTLSFGRNIGALMGTAASIGGDKQVTNIIDKAAYLYGIDIDSLKGRGITAHPAQARAISLFETEYVLVSTPGNPPLSLADLATVKHVNPLKGQATKLAVGKNEDTAHAMKQIIIKMGEITPETVKGLTVMDPKAVKSIIQYSKAVTKAANEFSGRIRDKEAILPTDGAQIMQNITTYNALIKQNLAILNKKPKKVKTVVSINE